jgi:hypothetical protein
MLKHNIGNSVYLKSVAIRIHLTKAYDFSYFAFQFATPTFVIYIYNMQSQHYRFYKGVRLNLCFMRLHDV